MNPLYEKFFFGELTDTEEQNLEQMLTRSEADAWDFGQAAEEIYKRYGLPEPDLPGEGGTKGPGFWSWGTPLILLLAALLAGFWVLKARLTPEEAEPVRKPLVPVVPMKKAIQRVEPIVKKALPAPVKPAEIPPSGTSEKVSGNNLNVVVHRETAGPVVVRVVDSMGAEVRRLFSGTVQAGKWSFEWDGRAGDGSLVGPGKYRIEVQTEGTTQSREVNIK